MSEAQMQRYIIDRYDGLAFMPEVLDYYRGSHYLNFGYWYEDTADQRQACDNLMAELLAMAGVPPAPAGPVLDVACGKGATTAYLLRHFPPERVHGINISEAQLTAARANAPGCDFQVMSATDLRFADNTFDLVICVEAAFHFYTRRRFLEEARRVLRPGGVLVLSDILMTREGEAKRESRTVENYLPDPAAYHALLEDCGYSQVTVRDATEESWRRHFWYAVRYFHQQFLDRRIDRQRLAQCLHQTYRRVADIEYYLLAAGRRPA